MFFFVLALNYVGYHRRSLSNMVRRLGHVVLSSLSGSGFDFEFPALRSIHMIMVVDKHRVAFRAAFTKTSFLVDFRRPLTLI